MTDLQVPSVGSLWRDKDKRAGERVVRVSSAYGLISRDGPRIRYYSTGTGNGASSKLARFVKAFERVEEPRA